MPRMLHCSSCSWWRRCRWCSRSRRRWPSAWARSKWWPCRPSVGSLVNLPISYYLTTRLGVAGVIWGTVLTTLVSNLAVPAVYLFRTLGIRPQTFLATHSARPWPGRPCSCWPRASAATLLPPEPIGASAMSRCVPLLLNLFVGTVAYIAGYCATPVGLRPGQPDPAAATSVPAGIVERSATRQLRVRLCLFRVDPHQPKPREVDDFPDAPGIAESLRQPAHGLTLAAPDRNPDGIRPEGQIFRVFGPGENGPIRPEVIAGGLDLDIERRGGRDDGDARARVVAVEIPGCPPPVGLQVIAIHMALQHGAESATPAPAIARLAIHGSLASPRDTRIR